MASLQFYATRTDMMTLIEWIYSETDCRVFEPYSRVNHELREFRNLLSFERERPADSSRGWLLLDLISP